MKLLKPLSISFTVIFLVALLVQTAFSQGTDQDAVPQVQPLLADLTQQIPLTLTVFTDASGTTKTLPLLLDIALQIGLADTVTSSVAVGAVTPPTVTLLSGEGTYYWTGEGSVFSSPNANSYRGTSFNYGEQLHVIDEQTTTANERWILVHDADGKEGWVVPTSLANQDPRSYFTAPSRGIVGYVLGNARDYYSSNEHYIALNDVFLGNVQIKIDQVKSIEIQENEQEPLVVTTKSGEQYTGTLPETSYGSSGITFITDEAIVQIDGSRPVTLEAITTE
jgi:hypothetical protein